MCGRYQTLDEREVRPGDRAVIMTSSGERTLRWGLKLQGDSRLLINARCETATQKPAFRHAMHQGRCIVSAKAFYEWDAKKHRHAFTSPQGDTLYMAGLYMMTDDGEERFVILTQPAQNGAENVHPRMPCLLPSSEYRYLWLHNDDVAAELMQEYVPLKIERIPEEAEQTDMFTS